MSDDHQFEDRLRSTFEAEVRALADRPATQIGSTESAPMAALIEASESGSQAGNGRFALSLAAAAVLLLVGIAGVIALGRSGEPVPIPVAAVGTAQPLVTATPTSVAPEPTAVTAATAVIEEPFLYTIQEGDLLSSLIERFGVTPDAVLRANPELDPNVLIVGDQIWIPTPGQPGARFDPPTPNPEATPSVSITEPAPRPSPTPPFGGTPVAVPSPQPATSPVVTEPACVTRDVGWLPRGTCGIEVIGSIVGLQVPVQFIDGGGRVNAGFVAIDALTVGEAVDTPIYQPGLLEDSWCVTEIFSPDTLNVRQGPSTDREIVGELIEGQCRIYRTAAAGSLTFDGWTPISADQPGGEPLTGWVASAYLRRNVDYVQSGVPMQTISVKVEPIGPGLVVPPVEAFELVDGTTRLGSPDSGGVIEIPAALVPIGLLAQAPVDGDPFCAWTGSLEQTDSAGYHVLRVAMLCA